MRLLLKMFTHSPCMFVWPRSSLKTVINCQGCNARFEFSNVNTVTVTVMESVGYDVLTSGFFGNSQTKVSD